MIYIQCNGNSFPDKKRIVNFIFLFENLVNRPYPAVNYEDS